jgi:hypothetical protein
LESSTTHPAERLNPGLAQVRQSTFTIFSYPLSAFFTLAWGPKQFRLVFGWFNEIKAIEEEEGVCRLCRICGRGVGFVKGSIFRII